jgi:hypothetical protein
MKFNHLINNFHRDPERSNKGSETFVRYNYENCQDWMIGKLYTMEEKINFHSV